MKRLFITFTLALAVACKSGYDKSERTTFDQPNDLPPRYTSPYGVSVYSSTPPTSQALAQIDQGIAATISAAFRPDAPINTSSWSRFRTPSEYRVLLVDTTARSQNESTLGCPLVSSFAGTAAGVTGGIQFTGSGLKEIWPHIILPKLTDTREECVMLFTVGAKHEAEHIVLLNDHAAFLAFTGENDRHPIF